MIKFSDNETRPLVISLWKNIFEDTDEYLDLIFSEKLKNENILLYIEDNQVVASLQMFPYSIRFYSEIIGLYYLAGLGTLPEYRNRGYMEQLILRSFQIMDERNIPLSILIPAEKSLFRYYEKYGFTQTFEKRNIGIDIKSIVDEYPNNIEKAFKYFDGQYQQTDFTILKTESDFKTIVEENKLFNYSIKYDLEGMSRIIDPLGLLKLYAKKNIQKSFTLRLDDGVMNKHNIYRIYAGEVMLSQDDIPDLILTEKQLTKLLFGFRMNDEKLQIRNLFQKKDPILNLMLE